MGYLYGSTIERTAFLWLQILKDNLGAECVFFFIFQTNMSRFVSPIMHCGTGSRRCFWRGLGRGVGHLGLTSVFRRLLL